MKRQIRGAAFAAAPFLIAERRGDGVFIKADIPDRDWDSVFRGRYSAALDLVIQVPQGINADVSDGSGDAKILNVGSLEASDGSGDFSVDGAAGTVRITDGPGNLTIENVGGDVKVSDGSGDIEVNKVGRDFQSGVEGQRQHRLQRGVGPGRCSGAPSGARTQGRRALVFLDGAVASSYGVAPVHESADWARPQRR